MSPTMGSGFWWFSLQQCLLRKISWLSGLRTSARLDTRLRSPATRGGASRTQSDGITRRTKNPCLLVSYTPLAAGQPRNSIDWVCRAHITRLTAFLQALFDAPARMAGRTCARLRLPPALAQAIDSGRSDLSVTFDNEGMTITLGDAAYALGQRRTTPLFRNFTSTPRRPTEIADGRIGARRHRFIKVPAAVAPTARDRAATKARTVDAATKAKSRQTTVDDGRRPRSGARLRRRRRRRRRRRGPSSARRRTSRTLGTEAARLFACADTSAPRLVEAFEDVKEVGVVFPSKEVYVIFGTGGGSVPTALSAGAVPCAVEDPESKRRAGLPRFI